MLYRLNVFHIPVPPLRERRSDIPGIVLRCLSEIGTRLEVEVAELPAAATARLARHSWQGNIRELRNVLERVLIRFKIHLAEGRQIPDDLWCSLVERALSDSALLDSSARLGSRSGGDEERERDEIIHALRNASGNVASASRALSVARSTLRYKIQRHRLSDIAGEQLREG